MHEARIVILPDFFSQFGFKNISINLPAINIELEDDVISTTGNYGKFYGEGYST